MGGYGTELVLGEPELQVHLPAVAGVDYGALRASPSASMLEQPTMNRATSSTGRWVADSPILVTGPSASSHRRSTEMLRWEPRLFPATACSSSRISVRAPFRCVAPALRREQDVERLGCRDQYVRRALRHRLPLFGRRVAGAHRGADLLQGHPLGLGLG